MASRGIRNRNPGNIRKDSFTHWEGESVFEHDNDFVVFETPEHGIRAIAIVLRNDRSKYGPTTVRQIINRWAAPVEKAVDNYVLAVIANWLDIDLDEDAFPRDRLAIDSMAMLVAAIIYYENGEQPYSTETIQRGLRMAGFD
jgi:hypothetical protein